VKLLTLVCLAISALSLPAPDVHAQTGNEIYESVVVQYDRAASAVRVEACTGCPSMVLNTTANTEIHVGSRVFPFDPVVGYSGVADVGADAKRGTLLWIRPAKVEGGKP
tara:strand:+ start:456 stop:782 length:327 start_codon:yes stop_codon:yes gene_type:complete